MRPLPPWHSNASTTNIGARLQAQYLAHRRADAGQQPFRLARPGAVKGKSEPEADPHQRFSLDREIRHDVTHDRQIDQRALECAPARDVMDRLAERLTRQARRAYREVEAREMRHLDDRADAVPLLAEHHRVQAVKLDLG